MRKAENAYSKKADDSTHVIQSNTDSTLDEAHELRRLDEAVVEIIKGMDFLIVSAKKANMCSIRQILTISRQDIINWAVNLDRELPEVERHKQEILFDTGLLVALNFITKHASTENVELKKHMLDSLEELKRHGINISSKSFM